jgi:hypothetical protein
MGFGLWGCCFIAHRPTRCHAHELNSLQARNKSASCSKKTMQQNSEESMGTQQTALTTVLMMGRWIVNVIRGIVYGIKANRGAWAPTDHRPKAP